MRSAKTRARALGPNGTPSKPSTAKPNSRPAPARRINPKNVKVSNVTRRPQ